MEKINELNDKRKLATIARIEEIKPIEGADNIESARVRGWWIVVKKGEFKIGDLVIYCEVDAIMPDGLSEEKKEEWRALNKQMSKVSTEEEKNSLRAQMNEISKINTRPEFEFLRAVKFHIKTRKLLGEISQGICFPLSILPKELFKVVKNDEGFLMLGDKILEENMDVTELLGVTQYIAPDPATMGGDAAGTLVSTGCLISDEERCLDENTLIETEDGNKTIKEICEKKYTGNVLSYNLDTFEKEWKPIVSHNIIRNNRDWFSLTLENGIKIITTSNHKFYLPELNCFRQLKDLKENDNLLIENTKN